MVNISKMCVYVCAHTTNAVVSWGALFGCFAFSLSFRYWYVHVILCICWMHRAVIENAAWNSRFCVCICWQSSIRRVCCRNSVVLDVCVCEWIWKHKITSLGKLKNHKIYLKLIFAKNKAILLIKTKCLIIIKGT